MNKEFFNTYENNDYEKLINFNATVGAFAHLQRMPEKHFYDASGITKDGREVCIELKTRKAIMTDDFKVSAQTFVSDDLFIDDYKLAMVLVEAITKKMEPLYVNFLEDGSTIIHNLQRITKTKNYYDKKCKSSGYEEYQICTRIGLYLDDAAIYNNEGKLIRKPLKIT